MQRYAVFGNPIKQSKSPLIHQLFANQFDMTIDYTAEIAEVETFEKAVRKFFADPIALGCNITAPFKQQAFDFANHLTEKALMAGAINTLMKTENNQILGHNTDGDGLVGDLVRLGIPLNDARILILGAGGATRGVLLPLLEKRPSQVVIANRTVAKAEQLADLSSSKRVSGIGFDVLNSIEDKYDLVINATSTGLAGQLPPINDDILAHIPIAYDMTYGDQPTPFMRHAAWLGISKTFDGLGMLVGQAAKSFEMWTGKTPATHPVIEALRKMLVN